MLTFRDLRKMAAARVEDAKALVAAGRYDGATYIVGYAIEYAIKARIATSLLACRGFPEKPQEFTSLCNLRNHKLEELVKIANRDTHVDRPRYKSTWSYFLNNWKPEARYSRVGSAT